ncbi:hypothetical protein D3C76_1220600 [compost metagenome]
MFAEARGRWLGHRQHQRLLITPELGQQRLQPLPCRCGKVTLAINPIQQAPTTELGQALVELAAETTELLIAGIAQGQHGIRQSGATLRMLALQVLPERRAAIRCVAVAKGAGNQQQAGGTVQLRQRDILHAAQLHRQANLTQLFGTLFGQGLTVAGLRGPE